jgi:hypothetical protein
MEAATHRKRESYVLQGFRAVLGKIPHAVVFIKSDVHREVLQPWQQKWLWTKAREE